ncbi:hypothetical protein C900_04777 [Fulvivirga imtechensis AK7]|uniref:Uncharacterized protein n=1 Tax=Fulvivirga imtechensis AK7 TaxID=1237149 RepID=L8JW71_9BACT|nr:hypothetical protein C900_04777 [Fulvivirga imtechensis AK7]
MVFLVRKILVFKKSNHFNDKLISSSILIQNLKRCFAQPYYLSI